MAGKSKLVRGALSELVDTIVPGDVKSIEQTPADEYLSRRLNLQRIALGEDAPAKNVKIHFGRLLDMPQWTKIDNKLDEISQQNEYDIDPDYFDDEGIDLSDISVITDTKDKVMGEAYFHYKSDGKFSDEVMPEFFPQIKDDLEVLRTDLGVDNKTFATLIEDAGYGPTANYYAGTEELKGWGLDPSFFKD